MSELGRKLAEAAERRRPAQAPPFDTIMRRRQQRQRARLLLGGAALAAAVVLAGTATGWLRATQREGLEVVPEVAASSAAAPAQGEVPVTGVLQMVGGRRGAPATPVPGTVTFTSDPTGSPTRVVRTAAAGPDGTFALTLPGGRYTVTGTSPQYLAGTCVVPEPVTVAESAVSGVHVICVRR